MWFIGSIVLVVLSVLRAVSADAVPWERLTKNDSMLLIVDFQTGLFQLTREWDHASYHNQMLAYSALGKVFNLPVVITTSAETGPNGPVPEEILQMYPDVKVVQRNGEVNAWDNSEFRAAVRATGKKQAIIAGIVTDVCTLFCALSLRAEGYSVFADVEASGTLSPVLRDAANRRMEQAGVQMYSLYGLVADLMRDWRHTPGFDEISPFLQKYMPVYSHLLQSHIAAGKNNGTA